MNFIKLAKSLQSFFVMWKLVSEGLKVGVKINNNAF